MLSSAETPSITCILLTLCPPFLQSKISETKLFCNHNWSGAAPTFFFFSHGEILGWPKDCSVQDWCYRNSKWTFWPTQYDLSQFCNYLKVSCIIWASASNHAGVTESWHYHCSRKMLPKALDKECEFVSDDLTLVIFCTCTALCPLRGQALLIPPWRVFQWGQNRCLPTWGRSDH